MSANLSVQMAAPLEDSAASTASPEIWLPPHPAATVELLRRRGHEVSYRRNRSGSIRYRIDDGREILAIEMSQFYARKYEQ